MYFAIVTEGTALESMIWNKLPTIGDLEEMDCLYGRN